LLIELAAGGLFRARWTDAIHDEWIRSVLSDRRDLTPNQLNRTRELMDKAVPDCLVEGYEDVIADLTLPDSNDRHVLAAAIHSGCDAIVTSNLKDFPKEYLRRFQLDVVHPDNFILRQFEIDNTAGLAAVQRCRARLRSPLKTVDEYLDVLERQGLPKRVAMLQSYAAVI
jgi:hypothetical protein